MPPQPAETTWLEGIVQIDAKDTPDGRVLLITLSNNHRYALPMFGPIRHTIHRFASPITIATELPQSNGDGTQLSGQ